MDDTANERERRHGGQLRTAVLLLLAIVVSVGAATALWMGDGSGDADLGSTLSGTPRRGSQELPAEGPNSADTVPEETIPADTVPEETVPIAETLGVYPGYGDEATLRELENVLGAQLGAVVQFGDRRSADEMVSSVQGALSRLQAWVDDGDPLYSLAIPLAYGDDNARDEDGRARIVDHLEQTAAGTHDEQYQLVADQLIGAGLDDAVLRLGHEFDGDWYPWSARASCQAYVEAFRHVAQLFRAESGSFRIEWTGTLRNFDKYGSCAYPGDDLVDVVGLDVYDRGGPLVTADDAGWIDPQATWEEEFGPRLESHLTFAIERGKPVSYPEWGLGLNLNLAPSGRDNPYFVESMADWFESLPQTGGGSLVYQAYFIGVASYDIRSAPDSWEVFKTRFSAP